MSTSSQMTFNLPDTNLAFRSFLSGYDPSLIFIEVSARGARLTVSGTPDELAEFLRRLAEQVDLGEKAIAARASEPLPLEVGA